MEDIRKNSQPEIIFFAILFLFFFQLLSDFIASVYAFGLLGISIPVETVSVLFLFTPILLFFFRKVPNTIILVFGYLFLLSRCIEPLLDTHGKMLVAGFGVGCFFMLFPCLILKSQEKNDFPKNVSTGLLLALCFSIFLKTVYSGFDISNHNWYQIINWLFAIVAGLILPKLEFRDNVKQNSVGKFKGLSLYCLSLVSVLTLIYFAFGSPHTIACWTGENHFQILVILLLALSGYLFLQRLPVQIPGKYLVFLNLLFIASLTASIYFNQTDFPNSPDAFPVYQAQNSILQKILLISMLIFSPVILINFKAVLTALTALSLSPRRLAEGFLFATLFLLIMIFSNIFTTVYSYTPVIGEFFRDKYWLVFLFAAAPLMITSMFLFDNQKGKLPSAPKSLFPIITVINIVAILFAIFLEAKPSKQTSIRQKLKILSFNIQQGYDANGQLNYDGQLEVLRIADADIIGLQETDVARISGGNADIVRYFSNNLGMYSYYGPKTVNGTFGIALLSKYPIKDARTFYMPSAGEQTATIVANIQIGDKTIRVLNTHLGNGGPRVQQETILNEIRNLDNIILMGDFNFESETEQYFLTTQSLMDAYTKVDSAKFISHRIDYIFISPQIKIEDMQYIESSASDHPAVLLTAWLE